MPIHARVTGTWRTVQQPQVRVAGAWRTVLAVWVRVAGTWRQCYTALSVSADPSFVSGASWIPGIVTTGHTLATPSLGGGTFAWRRISGDTGITATHPTSASTAFSAFVSSGEVVFGQFVCDYTLSGSTVTSNGVDVQIGHLV